MTTGIDGSLYPDRPVPRSLDTLPARIDYLARLCAAWDFGILPDPGTVEDLRSPAWREAVAACSFPTSPTLQLLRRWHGLPGERFLGSIPAHILEDESLGFV